MALLVDKSSFSVGYLVVFFRPTCAMIRFAAIYLKSLSILSFAATTTMLRPNATKIYLNEEDVRWHRAHLDARSRQSRALGRRVPSEQAFPSAYKHADIIEPESLPFGALKDDRIAKSPAKPTQKMSEDWSAVWEHLNRGTGFSPKVRSVNSKNPVVVTPTSEQSEIRSSTASIEGDEEPLTEPPADVTLPKATASKSNLEPWRQAVPALSINRSRPRHNAISAVQDDDLNDENPSSPADYGTPEDSSEASNGSSDPLHHMDVDGSGDNRMPTRNQTFLPYRSRPTTSTSTLNPQATPFTPNRPSAQECASRDEPVRITPDGAPQGPRTAISTFRTGQYPLGTTRRVDSLRYPSGPFLPSPLHMSHAVASSSPSRRSGSGVNEGSSIPPARYLSRPPKRPRDQASSPFGVPPTEPRAEVEADFQAEHRSPDRMMQFPHHSSPPTPDHHQVRTLSQAFVDLPPLPRYPFHHTPRRVSNAAAMPSPIPSTPPSYSHIIPNAEDSRTPAQPFLFSTPSPPPNTPTRSALRVYNDRLPASSQPQTPVGLPRHGIPAELARNNPAYTAPPRNGRAYWGPAQRGRHRIPDVERRDQWLMRNWAGFTSPTRGGGEEAGAGEDERGQARGTERRRPDRWVDWEGAENWER